MVDQTAQRIITVAHRPAIPAESVGRWIRIRYRALRVRRSARRAERDPWLDRVSPWAFWGLHR
ncbi:hypothetical protein [Leifsonia shinshuensis]|uniref:hypothetical protein n=1 Tax=Leifsonia shinshuensis TaxID=150026 RepID=UPI002855E6EA|nr:hypothetical protein [Leifsonia shinshuensis]MDR6972197.1 hypothetical protein [Leifsonia shinshuensis]